MGPLLGDELPVPAKDGVRCDERSNTCEGASPDGLAADSEPATLIIGQPESSAPELLLQDAVLLSEVFNDCVLMAVDPASERGHEDLPGLEHRRHLEIVANPMADRQLSLAAQVGLFLPGIGSAE